MSQNAPVDAPAPDNDICHPLSEFGDFPWDWIVSHECRISRGGVIGGVNLNPRKPHIDFVFEDIKVVAWEIPKQLAAMLEQHWLWGRREHAADIRQLLAET